MLCALYVTLGKGAFGEVSLAQDIDTGAWHAVKIQNVQGLAAKMMSESIAYTRKEEGERIRLENVVEKEIKQEAVVSTKAAEAQAKRVSKGDDISDVKTLTLIAKKSTA